MGDIGKSRLRLRSWHEPVVEIVFSAGGIAVLADGRRLDT
jgi:hypothetical protein